MRCVRSCCNWDGVSLFMVNMIVKNVMPYYYSCTGTNCFGVQNTELSLLPKLKQIEEIIKIMK